MSSGNAQLGAVGGLQAGYNWQFSPTWVAGIEGDISWASLADHRTNNPLSVAGVPVAGNSVSMSANTQWLSSVRGRLGFVGWNTLWYVTGGGAWANVEYAATSFVGPGGILNSVTSFNTTKTGWVVGGGAEWMATTNILLRVEYLYYGIDNAANGAAGVSPPNARIWPKALNYVGAATMFKCSGSQAATSSEHLASLRHEAPAHSRSFLLMRRYERRLEVQVLYQPAPPMTLGKCA